METHGHLQSFSDAVFRPPVRIVGRNDYVRLLPVDLSRLRRILVVKLDHVGDWVLGTPFLRNLRANASAATIDVVVSDPVLELAATCSDIDRAFAVKRDAGRFSFRGRCLADVAAFEHDYACRGFDLTVVPRWDVDFDRAGEIAEASKAPLIVGFSEICTERKRTLNRGYDRFYTHVLDDTRLVHEVEHNFGLITAANGRIITRRARLDLRERDVLRADQILSPLRRDRPLLAIAPFASEPKRCIPIEEMAELAEPALRSLCASAVIIGGVDDCVAGKHLASRLGAGVVSIAGKCGLRETAAVIRCCDAMIAADSGPAHIAAAVGTPVAVFSCHPVAGRPDHENSPLRFSPWGEVGSTLVLQPQTAVPPCRDRCEAAIPHCVIESTKSGKQRLHQFLQKALGTGLQGRHWQDDPTRLEIAEPSGTPDQELPTS